MANNPKHMENLKNFRPGESGNPKGRPRKLISQVNIDLESQGYSEVARHDIVSCYLRLMNIPLSEIEKMVNDVSQPALVHIAGKALLSGKGFEVIEQILDRVIGKAMDSIVLKTEPLTLHDYVKQLEENDEMDRLAKLNGTYAETEIERFSREKN